VIVDKLSVSRIMLANPMTMVTIMVIDSSPPVSVLYSCSL